MTKKELDLLQLSTIYMAEFRAGPSERNHADYNDLLSGAECGLETSIGCSDSIADEY